MIYAGRAVESARRGCCSGRCIRTPAASSGRSRRSRRRACWRRSPGSRRARAATSGCRFADRCAFRIAQCDAGEPDSRSSSRACSAMHPRERLAWPAAGGEPRQARREAPRTRPSPCSRSTRPVGVVRLDESPPRRLIRARRAGMRRACRRVGLREDNPRPLHRRVAPRAGRDACAYHGERCRASARKREPRIRQRLPVHIPEPLQRAEPAQDVAESWLRRLPSSSRRRTRPPRAG